jgi:hypothetical protein
VTAVFSRCRRYRYELRRTIAGEARGLVVFVMLNPSTADATRDDPTIRRCIGFARAWGYRELAVGNLFALRETHPAAMKRARDPVGPHNDRHLARLAAAADLVVCAWGNHGGHLARATAVLALLRNAGPAPHALRVTRLGQPAHPLRLPRSLVASESGLSPRRRG